MPIFQSNSMCTLGTNSFPSRQKAIPQLGRCRGRNSKEEYPMRVLCDVCEAAPARFFCAADEAALCPICDDKVHRCNKLASRHVRVQLVEARAFPQCDICENASAFFFCGIDGTSLCLQCDMDVHVGGKKTHERYLLLGQRVEFTNDKPAIAALQHLDVAKVMKRQHNQQPHKNHLCEPIQVKSDNGDASVNPVAMAVAEADVDFKQNASMMIDLNSRPLHMQGQSYNSSQNVRDMEVLSSSNGESAWVVPKISPKGKDPSQCR